MGGTVSSLPQLPQNFPYFCLTFRQWDKIQLVQADEGTITHILAAIGEIWSDGISNHGWDNGSYEIKFHGYPFTLRNSKSEAILSKRLACHLLVTLTQMGWEPVVSTDLGRTKDLTSWFFQRNMSLQQLMPPQIFCLSLSRHDKLQLVNATEGKLHI